MKRAFSVLLDTLHSVALALWLGGIVIIGAAVAPAAFHITGLTPQQSGLVVGESLRRFGAVVEVCGLVMVGAQFLLRRRFRYSRPLYIGDGVRQLLTFATFFVAEYARHNLFPAMDAMRVAGKWADFDRLHHLYTALAMAQVWLLVAVVALTAWLQLPRSAPTAVAAPAAAEPPQNPVRTQAPRRAAKGPR